MNRSYHIIYIYIIIISEWLFNMLKHRNFIQFHHYKPPQKSQTYPICGAMKSQVNSQGFPQKKPPQGEAAAAEADEAQKVAQVWVKPVKPSNQGISSNIKHITGWIWLVVSNVVYFSIIYGMSSLPLTNSYFSEG